ncbi:hypothetical protein MAR_016470, partial [Mya arenaria]
AIQIITDTTYGPGAGPILYNQVNCSGSETSIDECASISGEQCEHNQDVAIFISFITLLRRENCYVPDVIRMLFTAFPCPRAAEFYYGDFSRVALTAEGQEYHGICSNGTYTYDFTYLCLENGTWIATHNYCGPLSE